MTLIEVLVGIAIGLVGMLVMFQMLSVWDARTRATNAGGDAQIAGSIAMYNLERDIRLAGMGFGDADTAELSCAVGVNVSGFDNAASAALGFPFKPVVIVDNDGIGQPDQIAVLYGNSAFYVSKESYTNATATSARTLSRVGFRAGDLAIMTDRACTQRLVQVTDEPTVANDKVLAHDFGGGTYTDFYTASVKSVRYNTAAGTGATFTDGNIYNLGPIPHRNNWAINADTLGYSDDIGASAFFGVAEGVIDLKAQYGIDTDANGKITDTAPNEWMKAAPVDWTRVRAIRVALLVRSRNFEKPATSAQESAWVASNPAWSGGNFVMKNVDGTPDTAAFGDPNNWRHYRYRVYERIIPLRNVIWSN
jgi:type IV pilus assembly protein PilW